jgi:hypothetical protein
MDPDYVSLILLAFLGVAVFALLFGDAIGAMRHHTRIDDFEPATRDDPRCQYTAARQRRVLAKLIREGKSLLNSDRAYKPTLTRQQTAAPKANKVIVPFRRP